MRLYQLTFDNKYFEQAEDIFKAAQQFIANYSPGYCYHMMNLIRYYDKDAVTAVVALNAEGQYSHELRQLFFHAYLPHRLLVWRRPDDATLQKLIPYTADYAPTGGRTTLYLCHKGVCRKPITELSEMITALHEL